MWCCDLFGVLILVFVGFRTEENGRQMGEGRQDAYCRRGKAHFENNFYWTHLIGLTNMDFHWMVLGRVHWAVLTRYFPGSILSYGWVVLCVLGSVRTVGARGF